ncbi:unnamed protein product [Cunninghamella blakesleeana]
MDEKMPVKNNNKIICYSCENTATKKCMKCGNLLCLVHTEFIFQFCTILEVCFGCYQAEEDKSKKKEQDNSSAKIVFIGGLIGIFIMMLVILAALSI